MVLGLCLVKPMILLKAFAVRMPPQEMASREDTERVSRVGKASRLVLVLLSFHQIPLLLEGRKRVSALDLLPRRNSKVRMDKSWKATFANPQSACSAIVQSQSTGWRLIWKCNSHSQCGCWAPAKPRWRRCPRATIKSCLAQMSLSLWRPRSQREQTAAGLQSVFAGFECWHSKWTRISSWFTSFQHILHVWPSCVPPKKEPDATACHVSNACHGPVPSASPSALCGCNMTQSSSGATGSPDFDPNSSSYPCVVEVSNDRIRDLEGSYHPRTRRQNGTATQLIDPGA